MIGTILYILPLAASTGLSSSKQVYPDLGTNVQSTNKHFGLCARFFLTILAFPTNPKWAFFRPKEVVQETRNKILDSFFRPGNQEEISSGLLALLLFGKSGFMHENREHGFQKNERK